VLLGALLFSGGLRAKLRVLISKHLFSYRYDYRNEWLRFTQALSSADRGLDLGQSVIRALSDLVESPGGVLWLADAYGNCAMHSRLNHPQLPAAESLQSPFCRFLDERGWILNLEEFRLHPARYDGLVLPEWLAALDDAWLVIPLKTGERLIGFVVLSSPRTPFEIDWEVLDLLKTAQRQAAGYLDRMLAAEALLEARKFDSFNRMSAFVVHDLKNLVAQLSLMLRNAERHAANPDFQRDMLRTVEHVVGRMNHLMLQLRSGESPIDNPRAVDLAALVRNVQSTRVANARAMEVVSAVGVWALGHEDRLERVVAHLVQNGIEAAGERAHVVVRTFRDGDRAVVEIIDNGMGMSQEFIQNQLFKPFASTKDKGMGIGAYESHQYVTSLGGRIGVESTPGQGTTVRVVLPAAPPQGVFRSLEAAA